MRPSVLVCLAALLVGGCSQPQTAVRPDPARLTPDAIGYYDQMVVIGHLGPKAQVHLAGRPDPLWFTQVRDALAFQRMPEETGEITAIYVSDMGVAASWDDPGPDNWIAAETALFVVDSDRRGGMGAPELIPFADKDAAAAFAARHGGAIIRFNQIDDPMVLGPVEVEPGMEGMEHGGMQG